MESLHVTNAHINVHFPPSFVPLIAAVLLCYIFCARVVFPALTSPLRHIPAAHFTAQFSSLWINHIRNKFHENRTLLEAHRRFGNVVRLSPNEISINCVNDGIRTVYAGGYAKSSWYSNLFQNYDGVNVMFAETRNGPHAARKRMMTNVYAKSYLQSSPTMALVARNVIYGRLLPLLQVKERMDAPVNIRRVLESATMDLVTGYMFGLQSASKFLRNPDKAEWWLTRYQNRKAYTFWPQEMPKLTNFLAKFGIHLSPKWVSQANHDLEAWCLRRCDDAEDVLAQSEKVQEGDASKSQDFPVIYAQLRFQLQKEEQKTSAIPLSDAPQRLQVASEMLDHLSAGHETSAITLTFLFYELAIRPSLQYRLRAELQTLEPSICLPLSSSSTPDLPSAKSIDGLPLLHAVVQETLRRHAAIPGPQPRETPHPKQGSDNKIGPYTHIPAGVRISASAHCLHRNSNVFPTPQSWIPERWLDPFLYPQFAQDVSTHRPEGQKPCKTSQEEAEVLKEMHRWFWAFGSGGRMCIGSNLAMLQMKAIVASIVSCFRFELVGLNNEAMSEGKYENAWNQNKDDNGIKEPLEAPLLDQQDAYTAQPMAEKVEIRLRRWNEPSPTSETDDEF